MKTHADPAPRGIPLNRITLAPAVQSRVSLDHATVAEYAEAYAGGAIFPPIVCYDDGQTIWLADGFHRYHACQASPQRKHILAIVRSGSQRDAILCALACNHQHGLRRTHADKRRCVEVILSDREWSQWSNVKIAEHCGVSESLIRAIKRETQAQQQESAAGSKSGNSSRSSFKTSPIHARAADGAAEPELLDERDVAELRAKVRRLVAKLCRHALVLKTTPEALVRQYAAP